MKSFCIAVIGMLFAMTNPTMCSDRKPGAVMRGMMLDDNYMKLDGDTFFVSDVIGDRFLIVRKRSLETDYLIRKKSDGAYSLLAESPDIYTIENTTDFLCIGGDIYELNSQRRFPIPQVDISYGISYLGQYKGISAFGCNDKIWFTDGKSMSLRRHAYYFIPEEETVKSPKVELGLGAFSTVLSAAELYELSGTLSAKGGNTKAYHYSFHVDPKYMLDENIAGFEVELDLPQGNTQIDVAIRKWILETINRDVFHQVCEEPVALGKYETTDDFVKSLESYNVLWEKLYLEQFLLADSITPRLLSDIIIRKIEDNDNYVTYYYSNNMDFGGMHELPRSYYVTYDKRRSCFLSVANTVKPSMQKTLKTQMLHQLKKMYDERNPSEESTWSDSFDSYESEYVCDKTEWPSQIPEGDCPLPHFAILPEGVVLTFHPYQVDSFANGEYHVIVPFDKIRGCLNNDYSKVKTTGWRKEMFFNL